MRTIRNILMGTFLGSAIALLSLLAVRLALAMVALGAPGLPQYMVTAILLGGGLSGAFAFTLGHFVTRGERFLLSTLSYLAVAAAFILAGGFATFSKVPPLMLTIALINGLIIARVIGPLCARRAAGGSYLS